MLKLKELKYVDSESPIMNQRKNRPIIDRTFVREQNLRLTLQKKLDSMTILDRVDSAGSDEEKKSVQQSKEISNNG